MPDHSVILVEGLGKKYRLGQNLATYDSLREVVTGGVSALLRRVGAPRSRPATPDTLWALRDVSFEVRRGEAVGIIGRNGAGKSTLLKILSRITEPTAGRAQIRGRVGSLLEVGTGFHGDLTGRENIYLSGAILGMRRAEIARKFDEIVTFGEIERFIDTPVKRYSSGMYLRLAFAVAAHLEPEILLVDEVLAVGDIEFQRKCLGRMGDVTRGDRTVLFVSHNLVAVETLCTRALWLDGGHIVRDGRADAVIGEYLRSTSHATTECVWPDGPDAPGTEELRLHRVRVRAAGDLPPDVITVHTPFVFECEYWNRSPARGLRVHLELCDEAGMLLFDVGPPATPDSSNELCAPGLLRTTCHIPGDLLNDGRYRLTVTVLRGTAPIVRQPDALTFDIHDAVDERDGWCEKWPGAIRPRLQWSTNVRVAALRPSSIA
jgi:lipopolysaccharide transport system ATP-binding protein